VCHPAARILGKPFGILIFLVIGGCGTFYAVTIASKKFKGIPVVKQHRLINETLKKEIEGIHGIQVSYLALFLFYLHFHIDPIPYTQIKTVPL